MTAARAKLDRAVDAVIAAIRDDHDITSERLAQIEPFAAVARVLGPRYPASNWIALATARLAETDRKASLKFGAWLTQNRKAEITARLSRALIIIHNQQGVPREQSHSPT